MDWSNAGVGTLQLTDEVERWSIRPHKDIGWVHLIVEDTSGRSDLRKPPVDRMHFPATENSTAVGFFASEAEAKMAYAILKCAPKSNLSFEDEIEAWRIFPIDDHLFGDAIEWSRLTASPSSRDEAAPDTFQCYKFRDGTTEFALDRHPQVTSRLYRADDSGTTYCMMTAPDLYRRGWRKSWADAGLGSRVGPAESDGADRTVAIDGQKWLRGTTRAGRRG